MGIKTVPQPPYSPDLAPCDFCLFPKLRGYRYETIEEMKGAVTKVIDTLTQEDFHGVFRKLLERYSKCIASRRLLQRGLEFHVCTINKSAHRKKVWKFIVFTLYNTTSFKFNVAISINSIQNLQSFFCLFSYQIVPKKKFKLQISLINSLVITAIQS